MGLLTRQVASLNAMAAEHLAQLTKEERRLRKKQNEDMAMLLNSALGAVIEFAGIKWRVLEKADDKAMLLSEIILDRKPYHETDEGITWERSSIRRWLNGEFLDALPEGSRDLILETKVVNSDNAMHGTSGGNNTTDKVFLLSIDETNRYFANDEARIAQNRDGEADWWWLRSPGGDGGYAALVFHSGRVIDGGLGVVSGCGVRPALWI
jgi:hypothetical protein